MTLDEILQTPEKLKALSDIELKTLLEPVFPLIAQSILPTGKNKKSSAQLQFVKDQLNKQGYGDLFDKIKL